MTTAYRTPGTSRTNDQTGQSSQTSPTNNATTTYGRLVICTPTCERPKNLTELLESVRKLDRTGVDLHLAIVDNDADGSARDVVERVMGDSGIPVTYDCVTERNLPVVRNRLVQMAASLEPDWIWFLDDDQIVEPDAMQLMLATAEASDADCVVARVPHTFEGSSSPWAHWSGLFDEVHRPTGQPTKRFGTNGPLLRFASVAQLEGEPFDPGLKFVGGHHGGEDSHFFARFHALGFRSIGCDEAVIWDRLHGSRNNPQWLRQRSMRIGLVKGYLVREVNPSILQTAKWLGIGVGYSGLNLLQTLIRLPLGPSRYFRYWVRAAQGYGLILGVLFGRKSLHGRDVRTIHGE